ncbi:MAG TPA: shikimate dehydrogenase [Candidatus Limnocylindrales bacterium]|nr:shikimate dehydrogenase [Candidatus Limnocylindrales bacterium]
MIARDKICAVVAAPDAASAWKQLRAALRSVSTVELRLDWLASDAEIDRFLRRLASRKLPAGATLIATCRRRAAGGNYRGSIAKQLVHLAEALRAGCSWYDLEIESVRECLPELLDVLIGEGRRLASAHFFHRMPRRLDRVVRELGSGASDAIKIAAHCDSLNDGRKLLRIASRRRDSVVIPMGDVALPLRILALREGSALSYAPVENATAPGQVSLDEMKHLYRADRLDRRTRIYGIIGDPVAHSLSPVMQNAAFQARRMNGVYLPFLTHDLRDFLAALEPLGIAGFSITIPHKESILRHLDGCDPLAAAIGAVNTVVVRGGGKLYGYNTDYVGVLRALEPRIPLRGSRVLIVGSGGAARAVAFALASAGASVCVCARRAARAAALAKAVGGEAVARSRLRNEFFDAIVNATPLGMHPRAHESPLDARELNCRLVFDTIYRPRMTRLLQLAKRRGIETVSGIEMFIAQGTAQWEIWTGERAPVEIMRRAAIRALAREEKAAPPRQVR